MNSPITFTTEQQAILDVLYENYISLFATTASGTTSVTINATSGVATFTTVIPYESTTSLVINNTNITTDSIVQLSLKSNSTGAPTITKYSTSSGVLAINVLNVADGNGDPTDADLIISFQILN